MTARSAASVLRAAGRLVINPTEALTGTFPFGGTELGHSAEVTLRRLSDTFPIRAEEWGGIVVEKIRAGEQWLAAGYLRTWDPDALSRLFANTRTGAKTALPVVQLSANKSGGKRAGNRLSDVAVKLLFVPDDVYRAPSWIIYRALPDIDAARPLNFDRENELGVGFLFEGIPSATSGLEQGEIGPLVDLTLTPS